MSGKFVPPSVDATAFSCPHCGALTTQYWRSLKVTFRDDDNALPFRIKDLEEEKKIFLQNIPLGDFRDKHERHLEKIYLGVPFIDGRCENYTEHLQNSDVSECYNCKKLAFWLGNQLIWPAVNHAPVPNPDMPDEVQRDFLEAGIIADLSPRGAAALLRLCIQKICLHLGEGGKNINDDIASLVRKGLDPRVQKMLDVVRVIGNNAVHPGELDIKDSPEVVSKLFLIINMIVDVMISQPKAIEDLYSDLGPKAQSAIERRDGK